MAESVPTYKRLPGRGVRGEAVVAAAREFCTLWLAEDHLLHVCAVGGYTEKYKRFYFRDIQGFIVRKTARRSVYNWILGVLAGLLLLPILAIDDTAGKVALAIFAAPFLVMLLVNSLMGPTCRTYLKTAVQIEELPSLNRVNTFDKVLARIQPLIETNQGQLTPGEIQERIARGETISSAAPIPVMGIKSRNDGGALKHDHGRAHAFLFWMCLVSVVFLVIRFFFSPAGYSELCMGILGVTAVAALAAILRQGGTDIPKRLQVTAKVTLVFLVVLPLVTMIYGLIMVAGSGHMDADSGLDLMGDPILFGMVGLIIVYCLCVGAVGLSWLQHHRAATSVPPPVPPPALPPQAPPPIPPTV